MSTAALSTLPAPEEESRSQKYASFPLVHRMMLHEKSRTKALEENGKKQIFYPKSTDGWIKTLFVLEGRAMDRILLPWTVATLNGVMWTLIAELYLDDRPGVSFTSYESIFGLILSSSLSFLLVFRLNRSAERFWMARLAWGVIVASTRCLVDGVLVHGRHEPEQRDEAIRWLAGFPITLTNYMRGIPKFERGTLAGVLTDAEIDDLESLSNGPLSAIQKVRRHLKAIFRFDAETPMAIAQGHSFRLNLLEKELNTIVKQMGALERIRATPLPLVYVTHLRTFLMCFLIAIPYIWEANLGYATIPIVFITSFALLGLEGAAMEVEAPFHKDRPNHLSMDAYTLLIMNNIMQQIKEDANYNGILVGKTEFDGSAEVICV